MYISDNDGGRKQIQVYSSYGGECNIYDKDIYNNINIFQIRLKDKKLEVYLNNSMIGEKNNFNVNSLSNELYIGQRHTGANHFKGNIYSIRVYSEALSDEELQLNYQSDKEKYFRIYINDGLELHYNGTDHGNANNIWKDISGKGNDGKIIKNQAGDSATTNTWGTNYLTTGTNVIKSSKPVTLKQNFTAEITLKTSTTGGVFLIDARNSSEIGYQPLYYGGTNKRISIF